jgi:transposase-like protein
MARSPANMPRFRYLHQSLPEKITIDKSGANTAALESYNAEHEADIEIRQIKCLTRAFQFGFARICCSFFFRPAV